MSAFGVRADITKTCAFVRPQTNAAPRGARAGQWIIQAAAIWLVHARLLGFGRFADVFGLWPNCHNREGIVSQGNSGN